MDEALPDSAELLAALMHTLRRGRRSDAAICRTLTAMTHPRRQQILRVLGRHPLTLEGLRRETDISARALWRHLAKLADRGMVAKRDAFFCRVPQQERLAATLLRLASQ